MILACFFSITPSFLTSYLHIVLQYKYIYILYAFGTLACYTYKFDPIEWMNRQEGQEWLNSQIGKKTTTHGHKQQVHSNGYDFCDNSHIKHIFILEESDFFYIGRGKCTVSSRQNLEAPLMVPIFKLLEKFSFLFIQ